jgi:hypothetical protein
VENHSVGSGCLGRIGVQVSVLLEHREEFQSEGLVLSVSALATVFLKCTHHENVGKVERLLDHFIEGVAFHEDHVFVSEVHMKKENGGCMFEKEAAGALVSGPEGFLAHVALTRLE